MKRMDVSKHDSTHIAPHIPCRIPCRRRTFIDGLDRGDRARFLLGLNRAATTVRQDRNVIANESAATMPRHHAGRPRHSSPPKYCRGGLLSRAAPPWPPHRPRGKNLHPSPRDQNTTTAPLPRPPTTSP